MAGTCCIDEECFLCKIDTSSVPCNLIIHASCRNLNRAGVLSTGTYICLAFVWKPAQKCHLIHRKRSCDLVSSFVTCLGLPRLFCVLITPFLELTWLPSKLLCNFPWGFEFSILIQFYPFCIDFRGVAGRTHLEFRVRKEIQDLWGLRRQPGHAPVP